MFGSKYYYCCTIFFVIFNSRQITSGEIQPHCEAFAFDNSTIIGLRNSDIIYDLNLSSSVNSSLIKSLRIKSNCKLLSCSETKFRGECQEFSESLEFDPDTDLGFKSAKCKCSDGDENGNIRKENDCATFYSNWYYSGEIKRGIFPGSVELLRGTGTDIKSGIVREGCKVTFWGTDAVKDSWDFEGNETLIDNKNIGDKNWFCCHCDGASTEVCKSAQKNSEKMNNHEEDSSEKDFSQFVKHGKKIIGIGRNYRWKHSELTKVLKVPDVPIVFLKPSTSYIEEGQKIQLPKSLGTIFYETELGVVIGKKGKSIEKSSALDYVAGYFLGLDMTAKEFLKKSISQGKPWEIGKGFDTACAVGHFIPKHLIPNPNDIHLQCKINGNVTQSENTGQMIFDVPTLISYVSRFMTLEPYDVILTGTPDGLGAVSGGDVIESQLGNLTTIRFEIDVIDT